MAVFCFSFGKSTTKREKLLEAQTAVTASTGKLDGEKRFEAEKNGKRTRDKLTDKTKAKMYFKNYLVALK